MRNQALPLTAFMRRFVLFVLVAAAVTVGAPAAQAAPGCFGTPAGPNCDWVVNGDFELGEHGWSFQDPAAVVPISDPCLYSGRYVANLPRYGAISQRMNIGVGYGTRFEVNFDLFLRNDTESWWDSLKIVVKDLNTGTLEERQYNGNGFSGSACGVRFPLSRNYSGHAVELKFSTGALATGTYQVDDVQFWSLS